MTTYRTLCFRVRRMATVADGFTVEEMTALDAELAKKREKDTKELRNQRAKAFEDKLKNNHDNKLRVSGERHGLSWFP